MRALAVLGLVVGGCALDIETPSPRVWVDPAVPREAVVEALAVWNAEGANGTIVADRAQATVAIVPSAETDCAPTPDGHIWIGQYRAEEKIISVRLACYTETSPAATIAHELGHAIYIGHVEEPGALMNSRMDDVSPPVLTEADRAAYAVIWVR